MNERSRKTLPRTLAAVLLAVSLSCLGFAGILTDTLTVATPSELKTALDSAETSGNATILYYTAGTSAIELSEPVAVPSNVSIDLSTGGTLRIASGGVLDVGGTIIGGAVEVSGGTLLRETGSSITATITASGAGVVRGARVLSLENLNPASTESITAVTYAGESSADTSPYVTRAATAVLYPKMTGSNFSSFKVIETVTTSAGNVFRLGSRHTDTLSLSYPLTYGGLTGAHLDALNPVSYTASDAAILLNNPTKEGFVFAGWTCEQLGVRVPQEKMVIPEGTTSTLTLIAVWVETPAGGGNIAGSNNGASGNDSNNAQQDAAQQQQDAADQAQKETQPQEEQATRHQRTATSSTKASFTSGVDTAVPTVANLRESEPGSFPWGWTLGGLGALGILAYIAAKLVNRKAR